MLSPVLLIYHQLCIRSFNDPPLGFFNYKLALAKGICHLPLQRLNPVLLQLLTFDMP